MANCLKKYVTCDADEGGPETWCENCRKRLVGPASRLIETPEPIELIGWRADCKYCEHGIVKMTVRFDGTPEFGNCHCLFCGQSYFVPVPSDVAVWIKSQWAQKEQRA